MSFDPSLYTYASPLEGYQGLEALSTEKAADGKSLVNPAPTTPSEAYSAFTSPITNSVRGGFDIHIYFLQTDERETRFATELHERIRREFPELRIYPVFHRPVGPHPTGMFEVNLFTPQHFGAIVPWLVVNRGPLSVLVHPNTGEEVRDHSERATWLGTPQPLRLGFMRKMVAAREGKGEDA